MHWINIVAYIGLVAALAFLVLTVVLHFLPTGAHPLRDALGDYAARRFGGLMTAAILALGVGALAIAVALAGELGAHGGGKRVDVGVAFMVIFAAGMIIAALLPAAEEGAQPSTAGKVHTAAAVIAFIAFVLATIAISPVFKYVVAWVKLAPLFPRLELLVVVFGILMLLARVKPLRAVFGLIERLFFASCLVWLLLLGVHLSQIAR